MPTQPTQQPAPHLPRKSSADIPPPDLGTAAPKPADEGAIFRALLDAGAEATVAYTAEKRIHTMVSDAVAPQLQPFLAEMRRRFDQVDRRLDQVDRRFDEHDRKLDALAAAGVERDRRLDIVVARLDGLKLLGQIMFGAFVLLITALIAVFGFLFAA